MALCQEDENFELFLNPNTNQFKQLLPRSNKPHLQPQTLSNPVFRPPIQRHQYQPQYQNYQTQNYKPTFPSQPINVQPRQINTPQRFPTNRQTFGPPQNVWKPQNKPFNNPVPMSGVSKIPPNLPNRQNYPQPMSTNTRFSQMPPFHRNTEINTHQETDTTVENEEYYNPYDELSQLTHDISNPDECEYPPYDTDSYELQPNDPQQNFLTTTVSNNQT